MRLGDNDLQLKCKDCDTIWCYHTAVEFRVLQSRIEELDAEILILKAGIVSEQNIKKELEARLKEASMLIHDAKCEMERGPIVKDYLQSFFNVLNRLRKFDIAYFERRGR